MSSHPTKFWHKLSDGRIQCDVCPHNCKLKEEQKGLCFVRKCENGAIVSTTYGRSSGFAIDPVEKKPLFHFLPGTGVLSFGTAGCNLSCQFCQNWDISKAREMHIVSKKGMPKDIAATAAKLNCKSVAFTYNDPIVFLEYAIDTAKECHKRNIKAIAVTNGYMNNESRKEFFAHMDAANVDLKGFTDEFYSKITGTHLQPVLDTLIYLKNETKVWFEITTLLIPGENDSEKEIDLETKWIKENLGDDIPLHFSAFHPAWKMMDKSRTPVDTLIRSRDIALKNGLRYVYVGNVSTEDGENSFCHNCGKLVIKRVWYEITDYELTDDGHCKYCNTKCAGFFEGPVGDWGQRSVPVSIENKNK